MFWLLYLSGSLILSFTLATVSKKYFFELLFFFLILSLTPTKIDTSLSGYAPAIFTFIFNVIFEQDVSTRVLRPLLLTTPIGCLAILLYLFIKRRLV